MSEALAIDYSNREVIETLKQTVAKDATDAQLAQFLQVCKATGLNPFLKEVWCIAKTNTIMASRDGYLRVANDHPQFDGMETTVERENGKPIKATCKVWRKDRSRPIICEAYFNEYVKTSPVWQQYPSAMISKVAEVLALKRSFAINGVVTEEEIGETSLPKPRIITPAVNAISTTTEDPQVLASELRRIIYAICNKNKRVEPDEVLQTLTNNKKALMVKLDNAKDAKKLEGLIIQANEWLRVSEETIEDE